MGWEDEVIRAGKRTIEQNNENPKGQRRAFLDKCVQSAVKIIERYNEKFSQSGVLAGGKYITGGYEAHYSGAGIYGSISIVVIDYDAAAVKRYDNLIISVSCRAHSCVSQTKYNGEISESDVVGMVRYATRQPALTDRWRKLTGDWHGEL